MEEQLSYKEQVIGSNPIAGTAFRFVTFDRGYTVTMNAHGGSSSAVRASGRDPESREFESLLSPSNFYWIVGLFEGEGTFLKPPPSRPFSLVVAIEMTDEDVISRVATLTGVTYHRYVRANKPNWKPTYSVRLSDSRAFQFMQLIYSHMSIRRRSQIDEAFAAREAYMAGKRVHKVLTPDTRKEIASRFKAGERAVLLAEEYGIAREYVYRLAKK